MTGDEDWAYWWIKHLETGYNAKYGGMLDMVAWPVRFLLFAALLALITARGPYDYAAERRLMSELGVDVLLTKDSGGSHTVAKIDAAGDLGIPVVIITRPHRAPADQVTTVAAALGWLERLGLPRPGEGRTEPVL